MRPEFVNSPRINSYCVKLVAIVDGFCIETFRLTSSSSQCFIIMTYFVQKLFAFVFGYNSEFFFRCFARLTQKTMTIWCRRSCTLNTGRCLVWPAFVFKASDLILFNHAQNGGLYHSASLLIRMPPKLMKVNIERNSGLQVTNADGFIFQQRYSFNATIPR